MVYMCPGQDFGRDESQKMTMKDPEGQRKYDAIIDDIRHAVQEGGHAPFLSFSSLGTHRALKSSNFCFSVKIVCIVDVDK